jgi:hypothetical protein
MYIHIYIYIYIAVVEEMRPLLSQHGAGSIDPTKLFVGS